MNTVYRGGHALTDNNVAAERQFRADVLRNLRPGTLAHGLASHAFGDSYAHTRLYDDPDTPEVDEREKTYGPPLGHGPNGTAPDEITTRRALYAQYVRDLYSIFSAQALKGSQAITPAQLEELIDKATAAKDSTEQIAVLRDYASTNLGTPLEPYDPENRDVKRWSEFQSEHPKETMGQTLDAALRRYDDWARQVRVEPTK